MKTKSLILIAFVAIITLSFSFASTRSEKISVKNETTSIDQHANEPIGGFISEDKL